MSKWLFNIAAALSLLLLIATCVTWVRSYWLFEQLIWTRITGHRSLRTQRGIVVFNLLRADWSNQPANGFGLKYHRDIAYSPAWSKAARVFIVPDARDKIVQWEHAGFQWYKRTRFDGVVYITAVVPFRSLALATSPLPLLWMVLRLRSIRHKKQGLCAKCGYDLRASPTRCPECGALPI